MANLKYLRPVFMMCDLKLTMHAFVLGISEHGLSLGQGKVLAKR